VSVNDEVDKRQKGRVSFATDFFLTIDGKHHHFDETFDISMDGAFIASEKEYKAGTTGQFSFILSSGEKKGPEIKGGFEVVNYRKMHGKYKKAGLGIKFTSIDSDSSLELYRLTRYNTAD